MTEGRGRAAETPTAAPERIELTGLFSMMLGVWYPKNYIVAAIDPTEGAAAVKALLAAGFGGTSVRLEDGARVGQIRAAIYQQRTPLQRAAAAVSRALTDEGFMSQEYFEEAEAGASLITVLAPEPRLVSEARQIRAAHGARHARFYDDKCITDLTGDERQGPPRPRGPADAPPAIRWGRVGSEDHVWVGYDRRTAPVTNAIRSVVRERPP